MPRDNSTINIELTAEQIRDRPTDEKLAVMIEVGFANHRAIRRITELLEGNGKPGICEQVRSQKKQVLWLWGAFTGVAGFLGGTLVMHMTK